jgi:3-phenylpropionate/trans-cinnamate dioxygenase ferredoxin reductase component
MTKRIVIIGAGHAGTQTAVSLRDAGFDGEIILVGDEAHLPYQRPPLSKSYLLGKLERGGLNLKPPTLYGEQRITYMQGTRVVKIDRDDHAVVLGNFEKLPYDVLVIATGGQKVSLALPGSKLNGVVGLRTLDDVSEIKCRLPDVKNVVVIGGGFIGLEFAAVTRSLGIEVRVVELSERVLGRSTSPIMAKYIEDEHSRGGIGFRFRDKVGEFEGRGTLGSVRLVSGERLPADLALVAVGMVPNVDLAASAGLDVLDGIVVDSLLQTKDRDIFAIGDCARFPIGDEMVRLESVQNATDQARHVAAKIMGSSSPFAATPWFWSDQGSMKLQIAGLGHGADRFAVRGSVTSGSFSVFCFRGGRLVSVESMNRGTDHVLGRRLLAAQARLTEEQASDEAFPLKSAMPPSEPGARSEIPARTPRILPVSDAVAAKGQSSSS